MDCPYRKLAACDPFATMQEANGFAVFQTLDQAQKYVKDYNIEMVDLKFCDLWGRWHHLTIPTWQFSELMEKGIGFDGSAVGLMYVKAGDRVRVPDLCMVFMDPFWDMSTLSCVCKHSKPTRMPYLRTIHEISPFGRRST